MIEVKCSLVIRPSGISNAGVFRASDVSPLRATRFYQRLLCATLLAGGIMGEIRTSAQPAVEAWVQRYNGPGNRSDQPVAIALDDNGDVIVTGYSYSNSGGNDYATIKYSSAGVPLWTNRFTGPGNYEDKPTAMAVDGNGDVVVTGWVGFNGGGSYATIKYSGAGVPLWTNRYNSPWGWSDWATAIAVDDSGDVFVTGRAGGENFYLYYRYDYGTIKYSSAGVPLWTNYYNGIIGGQDYASAAGADGSGNVFVTGYSAMSNYPPWITRYECVTIKYANTGEPVWTNRFPTSEGDKGLAVSSNGNVFVRGNGFWLTGYSSAGFPLWTNYYTGSDNKGAQATASTVDAEGNVLVTGYSGSVSNLSDFATIKYSAAGLPLWTNLYNGPGNGADNAYAIAADRHANVFVTGMSSSNYLTIAYSSAGVPLWTNSYNGTGTSEDRPTAIAVDGMGNLYVTGYSIGSSTNYDYVTIKYASSGLPSLTIARTTANTLAVSWPSLAIDFTLQQSTNLDSTSWVPVGAVPTDDGTNQTVIVSPSDGNSFYRLMRP